MVRSPRWSRAALVAVTTIVVRCVFKRVPDSESGGLGRPAGDKRPRNDRARKRGAVHRDGLPGDRRGPLREAAAPDATHAAYVGEFKKITALDANTVEFQLCNPDVAFLSKIAFSAFGIDDSDYLAAHAADKSILDRAQRHRALQAQGVEQGQPARADGQRRLLGRQGPDAEPRVPLERRGRAALAGAPVGQRRRDRQPGHRRHRHHQGRLERGVLPARGPQHLLPRLQQHDQAVDQRQDPPGDRDGHRPPAHRRQLLPRGLRGGHALHAVRDPVRLRQATTRGPSTSRRPRRSSPRAWPRRASPRIDTKLQFRNAVRGYLPDPPQIATEIAQQLKTNLGIDAKLDLQESGAFLDANAAGTLDGIFLLGWGADYPDATNFLDYHFGSGSGKKFGAPFDDIVAALNKGAQSADNAVREAAYTEANNLIKQHVPMAIIAHGGSGTVFKADVTGAHSSPLSNEVFSVMKAGDRDTLVWMQNAEPLSLYCGGRDGRRDPPGLRAGQGVAVRVQGRRHGHRAGPGRVVHPERRPHGLDVQAAPGRDLPRRRRPSTPTTWSPATRPSGTRRTRSTWVAPAPSSTSPVCSAGSSTRPHPPRRVPSPRVRTTGAPTGRPRSAPVETLVPTHTGHPPPT